jgi:hypothetical protein
MDHVHQITRVEALENDAQSTVELHGLQELTVFVEQSGNGEIDKLKLLCIVVADRRHVKKRVCTRIRRDTGEQRLPAVKENEFVVL